MQIEKSERGRAGGKSNRGWTPLLESDAMGPERVSSRRLTRLEADQGVRREKEAV